jgi:hypothetical protein
MKNCIALSFLLALGLALNAQSTSEDKSVKDRSNKFGFGFKLQQVDQDYGIGMDFTSPYFAKGNMAVRLNVLFHYHEHYSLDLNENTWTPYVVSKLGFIGVGGRPVSFLRLYGEGGALMGIPSTEFSSGDLFFGGYGHFGFEFFMSNSSREVASYYIELGGVGSGGRADKLFGNPIYHNGFSIGTGFRFYL